MSGPQNSFMGFAIWTTLMNWIHDDLDVETPNLCLRCQLCTRPSVPICFHCSLGLYDHILDRFSITLQS